MSKTGYLIVAILILVVLLMTFIFSYILYRRTPIPKGCEHLKISDDNCSKCGHRDCSHYLGEDKE